jgi:hypothetical protein
MRAASSSVLQTATPAPAPASAPAPPATEWAPLGAIVAFVVVSSVVLGWIGWTKR